MSDSAFPLLPVRSRDGVSQVSTPAKLNLFLEIEGKRPDGFHELVTLLVAVNLIDDLQLNVRDDASEDRLQVSGSFAPEGPDNLVRRAIDLVRQDHSIPPLDLQLHKRIPAGAGLGGGSGNAAGALALLRERFVLDDPLEVWQQRAAAIGSDVPFFLSSGAAVARGRGERCEAFGPAFLGNDQPTFVLFLPPVHSETAAVFGQVSLPLTSPDGPISFDRKAFQTSTEWVNYLFNRLEGPVLGVSPELTSIVSWLEQRVAGRWRMTGSGSAFYAVCFDTKEAAMLRDLALSEFKLGQVADGLRSSDVLVVTCCRELGS